MAFIRRQLDDEAVSDCGRCDSCGGLSPIVPLDFGVVADAAAFVRHQSIDLQPRKRWPGGAGLPSGQISEAERLRPGRALSSYNDGGWGSTVKAAKYGGAIFPDELVEAALDLLRRWQPDPAPEWVACVPSATRPELVPGFARLLAERLGLPLLDVVRRVRNGQPQKEMENSSQQLRNVYRAFDVDSSVPNSPVLLFDDIVDSGWTLTVIGARLRRAGAGPVHPLVLARAVSS
jgi:ATP-dependent DNA helicase RecQ